MTPRACAECSACCFAPSIEALGKPAYSACPSTVESPEGSCSAYETRPDACSRYRCMWSLGMLEEKDRPDRIGVIFEAPRKLAESNAVRARLVSATLRGRQVLAALSEKLTLIVTDRDGEMLARGSRLPAARANA